MIRRGDRLENPVTGETLIFHETSRETGGESVLIETIVQPDGFVAAAHVHPHQTERFEVLEGRLGCVLEGGSSRPGRVRSPRSSRARRTASGTRETSRCASSAG